MTFEQAVKALELTVPCTDEPVDAIALLEILKEDVILAAEYPDSWAGANMRHLLIDHDFLN